MNEPNNLRFFNVTSHASDSWAKVKTDAQEIAKYIRDNSAEIDRLNQPGHKSTEVEVFLEKFITALGYVHEPKNEYADIALRPDYVKKVTGVILEVERGKIIQNNMDMLDLWKTHIHPDCEYLILVIPIELKHSENTSAEKPFEKVTKRLSNFFREGFETNVKGLALIGY